jgi:hypothetical protein
VKHYVILAGPAKFLIEAETEAQARDKFYAASPKHRQYSIGDLYVRVAHSLEILEHDRKNRVPHFDGQTELDLGGKS